MASQRPTATANAIFDAVGRIGPGGRRSSFRVAGVTGLAVGVVTAVLVARLRGQSTLITLALTAVGVASFLALVVLRGRREGVPRLICFHDQLASLTGATALLVLLREPVLDYLDLVVLGMGCLVAGGRVGCLLVGCCHGRPSTWGPRYGSAHIREGFPEEFADVRLVPVPLFEAVTLICSVAVGSWIALSGASPGSVLVWYVLSQVFVRFWLEFLRGDARPAAGAVSEAQWSAVMVTVVVGVATLASGWLVPSALAGTFLVVMVAAVVLTSRGPRGGTCSPEHLAEVLRVVQAARHLPDQMVVSTTPLGVLISAEHRSNGDRHYAFSRPSTPLTWPEAVTMGRVAWLTEPTGAAALAGRSNDVAPAGGSGGVYHLSVRAVSSTGGGST